MDGLERLNTLVPTMYRALNTVARELAGGIMGVTRDSNAQQVAIGQKIEFPISAKAGLRDVKAQANVPETTASDIDSKVLEITKAKAADVLYTGNEQLALGSSYQMILQDQLTEAMRSIVNEIEADLVSIAVSEGENAGNAIGVKTTVPFGTDIKMFTEAYKKLQDNGAGMSDLQAVLNTSASMNVRNLVQLQRVDNSGNDSLLRQGIIGNLMGFNIRESAGFKTHTKGTSGTTSDSAPLAKYKTNGIARKGTAKIAIDTGAGTFVQGDIVTFGDDTTKYIVASDVASGGTVLQLVTPLQKDVADNTDITIGDNYMASVVFPRNAIWLATRTCPLPQGGDKAIAARTITDPMTGLSFGISLYPGYKQNQIEVSSAWGVGVIKPEFVVPILG